MPPYAVKVFSDDPRHPIETLYVRRACRVMALLPVVLARHASCHRVRVYAGETLLFSVDGRGENVFD
ncbi:MAG: hypothetical protein K2X07_08445 [Caulobacteraceae bacterium]|nr:hypothetical protein [Caulobacteraceae bacterium]